MSAADSQPNPLSAAGTSSYRLRVTLDSTKGNSQFAWFDSGSSSDPIAQVVVFPAKNALKWSLTNLGVTSESECKLHTSSVRAQLRRLRDLYPVNPEHIQVVWLSMSQDQPGKVVAEHLVLRDPSLAWDAFAMEIMDMGRELQPEFGPSANDEPDIAPETLRQLHRLTKQERAQAEIERRIRETQLKRQQDAARKPPPRHTPTKPVAPTPAPTPKRVSLPVPSVPVRVEPARFDGTPPLAGMFADAPDLRDFLLRERASLWWVSNQSDDLLCLPYCAIERLEYQLRSALRVIGPMRGRALLSDEVGLGKTIEAGLVLKEYLTRGMVNRFLVLTLPSLVDQWEEELDAKFNIPAVTTNHAVFRADPAAFWRDHKAIIASIHTLKQDAHLAAAQHTAWDMLIVDEAHYLRNRSAKTWQAVNALPRQFLLLLTATPVQNSIEEIHNLVTLLQPGQLLSPKEFRDRFVNKDKPREPRDPDELRRLLGQVMIRNTRSNAGVKLPPRRAETVMFEPSADERAFWETWEREFRDTLAALSASQASLWGRLLLQAAGSSPQAWRDALAKFPDRAASNRWRSNAPLSESWKKKTGLLKPLAATEGGLVVFSQFLETQQALSDALRDAGLKTWVINGQTPAPQRQPITDQFRAEGGVLLLTHSGTEGRNLQFCHRLVNFDLPWNPMEIEQRIGRLHRLGQQRPVEIYNLVQAGTLQAHLLDILQEKLNLFELVVGETGLVLGERFTSDDFAEEVFRRWRESGNEVAAAMQSLGDELQSARNAFEEIKRVDQVLFEHDYETT